MRKTLIAVILTICTLVGANAQTRLVGRLVSVEQQAIEGATVTLVNQGVTTTTNEAGKFSLTYLEAIDEEVIVEAYGFMSDIILVQLIEKDSHITTKLWRDKQIEWLKNIVKSYNSEWAEGEKK